MKVWTVAIPFLVPPVACSSGPERSVPGTGTQDAPFHDASPMLEASPMLDASSSEVEPAGGGDAAVTPPIQPDGSGPPTIRMPRISGGVPAFASGNGGGTAPSYANDDDPMTSWSPNRLPAWIAFDLSKVAAAQRHSILVAWNAEHAGTYLNAAPPPSGNEMPTDYTIEINAGPGGTSTPPSAGWIQVVSVAKNVHNTLEHAVDLGGGNWVRMSITGSTDPNQVAIDLDIWSTPSGASDCWMFMGDSITYITLGYAFSNLPQVVHQSRGDRWPAVINAALGGTNTTTAMSVIDETLAGYPGRYVVLAYGTNDHATDFQMDALIQRVLAAGKIPVVPHMPWSNVPTTQTDGPLINQAIEALYVKYPQIVRGPDLWTAFKNRTDLIPSGDVHPNGAGQVFLRQQWATVMAALP